MRGWKSEVHKATYSVALLVFLGPLGLLGLLDRGSESGSGGGGSHGTAVGGPMANAAAVEASSRPRWHAGAGANPVEIMSGHFVLLMFDLSVTYTVDVRKALRSPRKNW